MLCLFIQCSSTKLYYDNTNYARDELSKYSDFNCIFPEGKFTVFTTNSIESVDSDFPNSIVLQIENLSKGQAKMVGNIGVGPVKVLKDSAGLTFIEIIPAGGYSFITIFGTKRKGENSFLAIFTKHNSTYIFPQSSQFFGSCAGLLK